MKRHLMALSATVMLLASGTSAASAQTTDIDQTPSLTPEQVRSEYTDEQLFFSPPTLPDPASDGASTFAVTVVDCAVVAQAPHISSTAGLGVIYKSRVKCTGKGNYPKTVTVRVRGGLFYNASSSPNDTKNINWKLVKKSDESRKVSVDGSTSTFYTPKTGSKGYKGKGHYQATSTLEITNPTGYKAGSHTSKVYWLNP